MTFGNYIYQDNTQQSRQAAIDQLINTADKLEAGHLKAVETASQLQAAIGQLDFNEAEDGFKQELLGELQKTIDDNVQYGNMYYALDDIIAKSGKIMSDPRVLGRLRAQKDYKAWETALNARTDINEDKKDWMRDLNKYNYEDKVDNNGKIIGGTKWTPIKQIGKDIDYGSLLIKAIHQVASKKISAGEHIEYLDEHGRPVDISADPNSIATAWIMKKDGVSREKLSETDIKDALNTLIATTPGAMTGLKEDYEFAIWYHNKHKNEEGYSDPYGITLNNTDILLSPEDYKDFRFNQGVKAASYLNIKTTTDQSIIYNPQLLTASNSGVNAGFGAGDDNILTVGISSMGVPTQYRINVDNNTKEKMAFSINSVKNIATKFNLPGYEFNDKDPEGSFSNAIQGILTLQAAGALTSEQAESAIKDIKIAQEDYSLAKSNNNAIRNSAITGLTGRDAKKYDDAMAFIRDFSSGTLDVTNQYFKKFTNEFNDIFKNKDGKIIEEKELEFNQERAQKLKQWCIDNDIDLKNYGIRFDGNKIIVPRNIQAALIIGRMIKDTMPYGNAVEEYDIDLKPGVSNFSGPGRGTLVATYNSERGKSYDTGGEFKILGNILKDATDFADKQNKKINEQGIEVRSQSYLLPNSDWTNVEEGIPASAGKAIYDDCKTRILNTASDLGQFIVYSFDKDDKKHHGNLVKYNETDARDLNDSFTKAKFSKKLQISPMIHNTEGVGAYMQFPEYKDGKETGKYITCFVVDIHKSKASEEWKYNPDVQAIQSVGKILDMPGQSDYAIRESSMPNLGEILMTGRKNDIVEINWKGKSYNTDITSARELKSYGIQLEYYKKLLQDGKLNDQSVQNLNQVLLKIANHVSNITNYSAELIYNDILKDFGLTQE